MQGRAEGCLRVYRRTHHHAPKAARAARGIATYERYIPPRSRRAAAFGSGSAIQRLLGASSAEQRELLRARDGLADKPVRRIRQ